MKCHGDYRLAYSSVGSRIDLFYGGKVISYSMGYPGGPRAQSKGVLRLNTRFSFKGKALVLYLTKY